MGTTPAKVKRVPVPWNYEGLNPEFLERMATIPPYAAEKYGSWEQYLDARLSGEKSPVNHIMGHLKEFRLRRLYDKFDGHPSWHLVAIAYNAMMEWEYVRRFGLARSPFEWASPAELAKQIAAAFSEMKSDARPARCGAKAAKKRDRKRVRA
jgi:hypothetical protein